MVQRNQSTLTFIVPQRPSISEIEGQPQRAVDMAVTRLRPSISEIEGQPQPGTRRIDAIRGPSISEIERSEEHTSELQSLMRISYAVFCLKKKHKQIQNHTRSQHRATIHPHTHITISKTHTLPITQL